MNIFGTDGIRGKVNQWPMTAELIQKVAISKAPVLDPGRIPSKKLLGNLSNFFVSSIHFFNFNFPSLDRWDLPIKLLLSSLNDHPLNFAVGPEENEGFRGFIGSVIYNN